MTRGARWLAPVMLGTAAAVFIALTLLRQAFPAAFPMIQGPSLLSRLIVGGIYIAAVILLSRAFRAAILRNPLLGDVINGAGAGAFLFVLRMVV